jgi:hypothetical protein
LHQTGLEDLPSRVTLRGCAKIKQTVWKHLSQVAAWLFATRNGALRAFLAKIPPIATPEAVRASLKPEFVAI